MYGNNYGYYNPRNIGVPTQPMNNQFIQQPVEQPLQNNMQSSAVINRNVLNGKQVDSIDVVKAIEYPLDGSVSYYPLTNGSAIVTKQLQADGTSKIVVFKPIDEEKVSPKYVTSEELKKSLEKIDLSDIDDLKEDIKDIKSEIKDLKKKKKDD